MIWMSTAQPHDPAYRSLQKGVFKQLDKRLFAQIAVILLLFCFSARIFAVSSFPPFIDEGVHVDFAELVQVQGLLARSEEGRQFTIWLHAIVQAPQKDGVVVARLVTVVVGLLSTAALLSLARTYAGISGTVLVAVLWALSPYHFFFDRLALADPIATAGVLLALAIASRIRKKVRWTDAVFCGLALTFAVGAKISALPFLGIPFAAALLLKPAQRPWAEQVRWLIIVCAVIAAALGSFFLLQIARGYDPFTLLTNGRKQAVLSLASIAENIRLTIDTISTYSPPLILIALLSLPLILRQRGWYLLAVTVAPLFALWISQGNHTRYLHTPMTILLVVIIAGWAEWTRRAPPRFKPVLRLIIPIFVLTWALVIGLPFASTSIGDPVNLPLLTNDRAEYISSDASGFGLDEAELLLREYSPGRVLGLFANCPGMKHSTDAELRLECPRVNPTGEDILPLADLLERSRASGVFAILESSPYVPSSAPGSVVGVIDHVSGRPRLTIYDLSP
jgi:hypothetical protein